MSRTSLRERPTDRGSASPRPGPCTEGRWAVLLLSLWENNQGTEVLQDLGSWGSVSSSPGGSGVQHWVRPGVKEDGVMA